MSTAIEKTQLPSHRGDISISEREARQFWADYFGVSEKEIVEAVEKVGGAPEKVQKFLDERYRAAG